MSLKLKGRYKPNEILQIKDGTKNIEFSLSDVQPEIKAIIFPPSCTIIKNGGKEICKIFPNLKEVIWPNIKRMNSHQFACCSKMKYFQTKSCLSFSQSAFFESGLISILLPKDLTELGIGCFKKCKNLKKVDMSILNVKSIAIPEDCFSNCTKLAEFDFSKCISIGAYSFNNTDIKRVELNFSDDSEGCVGIYSFVNSSIEHLKISGKVHLESCCFSNCYKLKKVELNSNITSLPTKSFYDDISLSEISGVEEVKEVGSYSFGNCSLSNLNEFTNLKVINSAAFIGNKFNEITVNADKIEDLAFGDMQLKKIVLTSPNLKKLSDRIFFNSHVEIMNLEHTGITVIPEEMFKNSFLKEITLPQKLTTIKSEAFSDSNLTKIIIPPSVSEVESYAFCECKQLTEVVWSPNCHKISGATFSSCINLNSFIGSEYIEYIENWAFSETSVNLNLPNLKEASPYAFLGSYSGTADLRNSIAVVDTSMIPHNVLLPYFYE